jgi:hypothetical protein
MTTTTKITTVIQELTLGFRFMATALIIKHPRTMDNQQKDQNKNKLCTITLTPVIIILISSIIITSQVKLRYTTPWVVVRTSSPYWGRGVSVCFLELGRIMAQKDL